MSGISFCRGCRKSLFPSREYCGSCARSKRVREHYRKGLTMSNVDVDTVTINGKKYVAADSITAHTPNCDGERYVLVTTAHRGVFAGWATDIDGETIKLRDARLCVYWSRETKGFMGLAANGPGSGCRIGPPATITLRDITSVSEVTDAARARWEAAPWD